MPGHRKRSDREGRLRDTSLVLPSNDALLSSEVPKKKEREISH